MTIQALEGIDEELAPNDGRQFKGHRRFGRFYGSVSLPGAWNGRALRAMAVARGYQSISAYIAALLRQDAQRLRKEWHEPLTAVWDTLARLEGEPDERTEPDDGTETDPVVDSTTRTPAVADVEEADGAGEGTDGE